MSLLVGVLVGVVVVGGVSVVGLWWWITRSPPDLREEVSQEWRNAHSRERRD